MTYRNAMFNKSMLSLDAFEEDVEDLSKAKFLSDNGSGVNRLVEALDASEEDEACRGLRSALECARALHTAEQRLRRAGLSAAIPVLRLICQNRAHRGRSIDALARRSGIAKNSARLRYFKSRSALLRFFGA